jgi:hypothetical protein
MTPEKLQARMGRRDAMFKVKVEEFAGRARIMMFSFQDKKSIFPQPLAKLLDCCRQEILEARAAYIDPTEILRLEELCGDIEYWAKN